MWMVYQLDTRHQICSVLADKLAAFTSYQVLVLLNLLIVRITTTSLNSQTGWAMLKPRSTNKTFDGFRLFSYWKQTENRHGTIRSKTLYISASTGTRLCSLHTTIISTTSQLLLNLQPCCCCCLHSPACSLVKFQLATDSHTSLWSSMGSNQLTHCIGLAWPGLLKLDNKPCPGSCAGAEPSPASLPLICTVSMLWECPLGIHPINLVVRYSNWGAANPLVKRSAIWLVVSTFCTLISSLRCSLKKWYFTAMCLVWKVTLLVASANHIALLLSSHTQLKILDCWQ